MFSKVDDLRGLSQTLPDAITLSRKGLEPGEEDGKHGNATENQNFSFGDDAQAGKDSRTRTQARISRIMPANAFESESDLSRHAAQPPRVG